MTHNAEHKYDQNEDKNDNDIINDEIKGGDLFITGEAPEFPVYLVVSKQAIVLVRTVLAIVPLEDYIMIQLILVQKYSNTKVLIH